MRRTVPLAALYVLFATSASAASPGPYLFLPTVPGQSTVAGQKNWTDISSMQWGVGVGISSPSAGQARRTVSDPSVSDIVWSQDLDGNTAKLFSAATTGKPTQGVRFGILSGSGRDTPYLSLELGKKTFVTGVSLSNTSVSGSIVSDTYKLIYTPEGLGRSGTPLITELDVAINSSSGPTIRSAKPFTGTAPAAMSGQTKMYLRLGEGSSPIAGTARRRVTRIGSNSTRYSWGWAAAFWTLQERVHTSAS